MIRASTIRMREASSPAWKISWTMPYSQSYSARPNGLVTAASWMAVHSSAGDVMLTGRSLRFLRTLDDMLASRGSRIRLGSLGGGMVGLFGRFSRVNARRHQNEHP